MSIELRRLQIRAIEKKTLEKARCECQDVYNSRGENSHIKRTGVLRGNFEKKPKRCQDPVLLAWIEIIFTSKRYLL